MIAWSTVELGLRTWISTGIGVNLDHVLPQPLRGPRPTSPYAAYKINIAPQGRDWEKIEDATAPVTPGEEIVVSAIGVRRLTVSVQVWGDPVAGSSSAKGLLEQLIGKSYLPSLRDILRTAGVSLLSWGTIQSLDQVINSTSQDVRAALDITMTVSSSVSEPATYIEFAETEGTIT